MEKLAIQTKTTLSDRSTTENGTKVGWRKVKLGEILEITSSKRIFMSEYKKSGVPFYRGKEIIEKHNGADEISTPLFISEEKFSEIKNRFGAPKENDILLSSVGTLGVPYMVKKDEQFYFKDGNLTWFRNYSNNADPKFIYYWLTSRVGQNSILSSTIGSSQQALTIDGLKKTEINLPDNVSDQKRIADILSAFDDKIENNNKIIKNLEETTRSIFKEWFVKFKFPGSEKIKMVDSELGKIPDGWKVKNVLEIIKRIPSGKKYDNKTALPKGNVPILDQGQSGWIGFHNDEPGVSASIDEPVVVFTNHTCNYWLITYPFSAIQNILPYIGINGYPTLFIYYLTREKIKMQEYKGHWPDFEQQEFLVPMPKLAEEYSALIGPIVKKIIKSETENKKLSVIRDLLLSKLMSGEIRV
ncbi:MAG: restriction endonuclease subunit S [bacterium]|nr:restriction endonuclease subunit S [bacterium]